MSLLLDALKRAEQEKLARQAQAPQAEGTADGEPAPPGTPEAPKRRKLELESHEPAPAAPAPAPAAEKRDREAVKTAFAAKKADLPPAEPVARGRKAILAIAGVALLLVAAGGAYVWYEVSAVSAPQARAPLPLRAAKPVTPASTAASAPSPAPLAGSPAAPPRTLFGKAEPPEAATKGGPSTDRPAPKPSPSAMLAESVLRESARVEPASPPKLSRTVEAPRLPSEISRGYEALKRGDWVAARELYGAAVAADGTSMDALLGLAAAHARTGDRDAAARLYRRALALDPKNAAAAAGLFALAGFSRPEGLEAQLRADVTRHPESPELQFTLGNLYASQSRWNEAQAAYFEAYRRDPDNADLAFNLAVSLDQLGQPRLALDYYRRALAASRQRAAQFDAGQVARRIAELKP